MIRVGREWDSQLCLSSPTHVFLVLVLDVVVMPPLDLAIPAATQDLMRNNEVQAQK